MKRALISVYDKTNLQLLAEKFHQGGVEIISTGSTYNFLVEHGFKPKKLSECIDFPEIIGGRVKTLHPKIHGGILADREIHSSEIKQYDITPIDFVVVNLYPFQECVEKNPQEEEIMENIDIGGVTLIRAAAKNFKYVCVLSDPEDYKNFSLDCDIVFRRQMAKKAFQKTAAYDCAIANWFAMDESLPSAINISAKKKLLFRYGENPHQEAAFYKNGELAFTKLQGKELSYNNLLDTESALAIVDEFQEPTCVIVKHNNPCGVATSTVGLEDAYHKAFKSDHLSAFGGVVAFNGQIVKELADELCKVFFEIIIANSITQDALDVFSGKKNLRILILQPEQKRNNQKLVVRSALDGFLVQEQNKKLFNDFEVVTKREPSSNEVEQLKFAWKVCKHVKSNAIVTVKDFKTVGIGAGQMSRIRSTEIALEKLESRDLIMASDAFFPFADSIEIAAKNGVLAIIQPGGSIKDKEVIEEANKHNIAMVFTGMRHFKH